MRLPWQTEDPGQLARDVERWWAGDLHARGPHFLRRYLDQRLFRRIGRADQAELDRALEGRAPASVSELPRAANHQQRHAA